MADSKRARSWKRRTQPRIDLTNAEPVLYSTRCRLPSAVDLPRVASRYCAPTDVPERNNCLPRIWTSVFLGSSENSLIMPSAYSFVLSLRSLSPMVGRLHPLSFSLYPFKPAVFVARDRDCLEGLSRFDNSQNVKMTPPNSLPTEEPLKRSPSS
jgi:hypothetical protein